MNKEERHVLRDSLRNARKALSNAQQSEASSELAALVADENFFKHAKKLALYISVDGEIDPRPLVDLALSAGKDCFLPVINRDTQETLSFAPFDAKTELIENQWGIAEPPLPEEDMSSTDFDVVFVPLVGFDANCFRLGMGKGFYDRTFSFKIFNRRSQPLLVGLAHDCQLTEPFPTESWDVRLDAVITAEKIYRPDTA
ncbi:MAG TPA: 5-formyltetrahydrofolate cyclo-ligase [Gammaproteobacteria bacterium]|nr:5-formyltetrahydrofolate cyclo-ligase [Gammaproteobacteria bacterium]|tara:strand:+ start:5874 stop:6470 length:597 start_codon:yes stop_codon:yes gene_type:complete